MNARKIIVEILDNVLLNGAYSNIEINKQFASNDIDPVSYTHLTLPTTWNV